MSRRMRPPFRDHWLVLRGVSRMKGLAELCLATHRYREGCRRRLLHRCTRRHPCR